MKLPLFLLLASVALAKGQIYADFTVSHGTTPLGTFRARLDHDKAPRTCANFIGLATGQRPWIKVTTGQIMENRPYYDGLKFHRLIHNFVIQGGSPNGLGTDGPGYVIQDEYHGDLRHTGRYFLSMAKTNQPNTGGSQFFITLAATPTLDDKHSIFGEVITGRAIIDGFTNPTAFPTDTSVAGASSTNPAYSNRPVTPITMNSVVISGPDLAGFNLNLPAHKLPVIGVPALRPQRNAAANTFTLGFDRAPQTEYFMTYSFNLASWVPFLYGLSFNAEAGEEIILTGVTFPRFFMRMASADYGALTNAPPAITQAGRKLRITNRTGGWVELTFNGSTGGTWSASDNSSGSLSAVAWSDLAASSGLITLSSPQIKLLPLGTLSATFNVPTGVGGWKSFNQLTFSFHDSNSGWVEGVASNGTSNVTVNQSFTLTP